MEIRKPGSRAFSRGKAVNKTSTKGLDGIIMGVMSLTFLLTPLFFTGFVAQGLGFEKLILFYFLILIGIVSWVTKGIINGELSLKRTPLDIPILTIIALFSVSTMLSVSTKDSIIGAYGNSAKGLATVIIMALFYYLVVNNLNTARIKAIFWTIIASSTVLIAYTLLQLNGVYLLPMSFTHSPSFNPLGSLTSLTMYIVMVLPMLVVATTQVREILPKANKTLVIILKTILGAITLSAFAILAILNGFTFWPIAIVGLVIVLMFFLAKIIKVSNNNLIIPLFSFLVLIIFLVLGNFSFGNINLPSEISLSRGASWDIAKSSLKSNPIFGSGPSTFYYDFSKFKNTDFNASPLWNIRFDSAYGALFELLATVGILGTLAVVFLALVALSISFLTLIKANNKETNSILLALFAGLVSSMLFALLFSQNNAIIITSLTFSIFAISSALVLYPEKFKDLTLSFRASPKYALGLAAIFLCVSSGVVILFTMGLKMYKADMYAKQSLTTQSVSEKIELLNKATELAPYQDSYYLSLASNYMSLANQKALDKEDQAEIASLLAQAIEQGKKAVEISDNKASNNESLALIYENASFYTRGALEWSENLYNKVIELDPNNPMPYLRIALINMARANAEESEEEKEFYINEAINKYDEAISKKGDLAAAYYGKAIASEKLVNIDDAIEQLKKANLVSRNNLNYRFELGRLYFNRGVSQMALSQNNSQAIAEADVTPELDENGEILSVQPTRPTGAVIEKNEDLRNAEQLFKSITGANPKHANTIYSLAVLYKKTGENKLAKEQIQLLLEIVTDPEVRKAINKQFEGIY